MELEINKTEAQELLSKGSNIYLFEDNFTDSEYLSATFEMPENRVFAIDMNEAYPILMNYDKDGDLQKMADKFKEGVIVCPHGNTSKKFALALVNFKVTAYSLKGGIAGLKERLF